MRTLLKICIGLAAVACLVAGTGVAGPAQAAGALSRATCSGGAITAGTYSSLTVTGVCFIPSGTVTVLGNLIIAPNAALNAATGTGQLNVSGNALVGKNATFVLGCSPEAGCDHTTSDRVSGNVVADRALALIFHSNTIRGNVIVQGGGGGVTCATPMPFGGPAYSTFEDSHINGNVVVSGYHSCWFGLIRNSVHGNVILTNNTFADPDAMETVTNTISGNLICFGNSPAPQVGDSMGNLNIVRGNKIGQCASV
jgi:hypothetical protein